jgi:hypothetical protein
MIITPKEKPEKGGNKMTAKKIKFSDSCVIDSVKELVDIVGRCDYDVDVVHGRYVVDAKSIMGWFSLDLSETLVLMLHTESCDDVLGKLSKFIVS